MAAHFHQVPIRTVREYWNNRPCNIRHSRKPVGDRDYFDEVEQRKYYVEPHIPAFAEFERWRDKTILEVGCGIGTDTINFARSGAQVTAVDLSENSLEIARRRAQVYGLQNITFLHANAEELTKSVGGRKFDLVYSFGVLHHTPNPERALTEIGALLRPGGTLKLMVYHRHSWKAFHVLSTYGRGAFWDLDRIVARHSEAQEGCPVTYTYTAGQVRKLMSSLGFDIESIRIDHIFPWRIPDYVEYRYRRVWYFAALPRPVFRWLERHFGWHLCVTAVKT